jgi:hypothetical protein
METENAALVAQPRTRAGSIKPGSDTTATDPDIGSGLPSVDLEMQLPGSDQRQSYTVVNEVALSGGSLMEKNNQQPIVQQVMTVWRQYHAHQADEIGKMII